MSVADFADQMARATRKLPGSEELAAAAKRAAERTNTQLAQSGFSQRCVVLGKESGYRIELRTSGRGIGRHTSGGMSPQELLEQNVRQEVDRAARATQQRGLPS
jgi:hypothetical protein